MFQITPPCNDVMPQNEQGCGRGRTGWIRGRFRALSADDRHRQACRRKGWTFTPPSAGIPVPGALGLEGNSTGQDGPVVSANEHGGLITGRSHCSYLPTAAPLPDLSLLAPTDVVFRSLNQHLGSGSGIHPHFRANEG
jgi:hypothetical protein